MDVRDGGIVAELGLALVVASLADGELLHGYGVGPSAFLLHVGILYLAVGALAVAFDARSPLFVALGGHALLFAVACTLLYYDLVVTPPEYGMVPTPTDILVNQAELTLALFPVSVGYLAGALGGRPNRGLADPPLLLGVSVLGPTLGTTISLVGGSAPGFTQVVFALLGLGAFVAGVPLYVVTRRARD